MKKINTPYKSFLVVLLLVSAIGIAQTKKLKIAEKEFDRYSYIDAREIYLEVVEDGYQSAEIFQKLGDTYYWNSDYDNAAKWYKKLVEIYPSEMETIYYYRAAQSLKSVGDYKTSDALMEKYIALGGEGMVVEDYTNNPNYLQSINKGEQAYVLEKIGVNTAYSDFAPMFYQDKLVFTSSSTDAEGTKNFEWNDQPFLDLFIADVDSEGNVSNATNLSGDVNTPYHESSATFSKDGNTMYFTRSNYFEGKKRKDKDKTILLKVFKATKDVSGRWGSISELPFNSNKYSVAHPALSVDEKKLYFTSDMPGTLGMSDIWYVDIMANNAYGQPVNLGKTINTEARESFPFISKKGKMYFSSDGRSGLGGYDIYVATLNTTGMATAIQNVGKPANSSKDDFGFIINETTGKGYLSSNREGTNGSIDDDIYSFNTICEIVLLGTVIDLDTRKVIPGATVVLLNDENTILGQTTADTKGAYQFSIDCNSSFIVRALKDTYEPNEIFLSSPKVSGTITSSVELKSSDPCPPNDLGCRLSLQPIYFDLDKSNIRPDAAVELAKILSAMRQYPDLKIHIESHTDSRASKGYNNALSERRAKSTREWLIAKGINENRLTSKGYGESQLINKCSDGVTCTEEEHQLNRRSMFIIKE